MNKNLKLTIGILISAAGLWYAFREMNFKDLMENLSHTHMSYVFLSMIIMVISVALRAYRWQLILNPIHVFTFNPLFSSTMIGYFGNGVLPFRLGELLRAYAISQSRYITASAAFGTIILERLFDMIGLVALMIFFAFFTPLMEWSGNILVGLLILTLGGLLFILWLGKSHSKFHDKVVHWKIFEKPSRKKLLKSIQQVFEGLISIRDTKHTGQLIVLTVVLWILYYMSTALIVIATGIELTWFATGIVLIVTTLAIAVPSAPGFVGTYHAAVVYVLVNIFNAGLTESQAFSVLIHAVGFVPLVIIGFVYFLRSSIHFKDVKSKEIIA